MEKKYFWLKLQSDFFQSLRIKKLRRLAGGDTYTIIYLKMQLLSIKTDGILTYTGLEDDMADEIALDIDEDAENVKAFLLYGLNCGLVEKVDNSHFFLPFAAANVGKEGSSARRMRDLREKQKEQQSLDTTEVKALPEDSEASQCDSDVTKRDADVTNLLRRDRERDRDRDRKRETSKEKSPTVDNVDNSAHDEILDLDDEPASNSPIKISRTSPPESFFVVNEYILAKAPRTDIRPFWNYWSAKGWAKDGFIVDWRKLADDWLLSINVLKNEPYGNLTAIVDGLAKAVSPG